MRLFNFFRNQPLTPEAPIGQNGGTEPQPPVHQTPVEPKDERKAECPYCHNALAKIPGKKTKCPNCGETMFVRTRPKDNVRLVVTKEEADKIEEDWSIIAGTHDVFIAEKEEFKNEKEKLRVRFGGMEPSDRDVAWSLHNKALIEHIKLGDWGLYRNTKLQMAELLTREVKFRPALEFYLEICYLDLNGPRNLGGITDAEILKEFPAFDLKQNFLAPGIIDTIQRIMKKLSLSKYELKLLFIEHNSKIANALRLPLLPADGWNMLEKELDSN